MKMAVIGCGLRTPLLIDGLARAGLERSRLVLYDIRPERAQLMAALGGAIAAGSGLETAAEGSLPAAIQDCAFVFSSIRVGDMAGRARDERLALECGFVGQETTGPGGFAMALRTVPVALEHARLVEKAARGAWIISFTNPAGLVTQAITQHAGARAIGICDTPSELFYRISLALGEPPADVECDYLGLNHLGWVRGVRVRGEEAIDRLLADDERLRALYPAPLFAPQLIRALRLIPTEYLYFYYSQRAARANQLKAGATRAEELARLNQKVIQELEADLRKGNAQAALEAYRGYLNRRNGSYMQLEGAAKSASAQPDSDWDPFQGVTGYHRIAVEAIGALGSSEARRMVLNVPNEGTIPQLQPQDVIETPCLVDRRGPRQIGSGGLPAAVEGLTLAVKTYERLTIEAALRRDRDLARLALFTNPMVGDWEAAREFMDRLLAASAPGSI